MAAKKRTPGQREQDLHTVAVDWVRGVTLAESGRRLGVSHVQAYADRRELMKRWRKDQVATVDEIVTRHLRVYEEVAAEAWEAFERSKGERRIEVVEQLPDGTTRTSIRLEHGVGDDAWLGRILQVMKQTEALLGLAAPERHLVLAGNLGGARGGTTVTEYAMTPERVDEQMRMLAQFVLPLPPGVSEEDMLEGTVVIEDRAGAEADAPTDR